MLAMAKQPQTAPVVSNEERRNLVQKHLERATTSSAPPQPPDSCFAVLGRGVGGLEEMQQRLSAQENMQPLVAFGLLTFTFGKGSFAREKSIFVHFVSQDCPAVKRGRWNSLGKTAKDLIGKTNADVMITEVGQCCLDHILKTSGSAFADDSAMKRGKRGSFTISNLHQQYEEMIVASEKQKQEEESNVDVQA
jgi:hypothetical protein